MDSETYYQRIFETARDGILILDGKTGEITDVNPYLLKMLGYSSEEFLGKKPWEISSFKNIAASREPFLELQKKEHGRHEAVQLENKSGQLVEVEFVSNSYPVGNKQVIQWNMREITGRKRAVEELRLAETKYRSLVEQLPAAIYIDAINETSSTLFFSSRIEAITGYSAGEWENDPELWVKLLHPDDRERVLAENAHTNEVGGQFRTEYRLIARDGQTVWVSDEAVMIYDSAGRPNCWQGILLDITARKQAEGQIQSQIKRLAALRTIDTAIANSVDLPTTLDIALGQAVALLGVDAADVLLLNPHTLILNYAAGRGFRTNALQHTHLKIGEGYAGMAALERKTISITELHSHKTDLLRSPTFRSEDFNIYICTPLIAKGEVKGVLEIYHRSLLETSSDWLEFLETIAGQVAIAIDSALMFTGLQQANIDLTIAYDNTIEGWSKALDLRDNKTEGHTLRVTEVTLNLAVAMGMDETDLVHVRRGALLHDIGKMGIPDSILLKPGPLTAEEWGVMHKHPLFAYELLSPIPYLRPALNIPYCHHEKWDGTGYPRGLKGEDIPLAARLFAVVDVWDALGSDRPYRKAWSAEKVLGHIKSLAGTHFDPKAVESFLNLLGQS